jgi:hypothetical protein
MSIRVCNVRKILKKHDKFLLIQFRLHLKTIENANGLKG